MAVKRYNFAPSIFLIELTTQCMLAKECERLLREAAPGWYKHASDEQVLKQMSPLSIMTYCAAFLSAAGVISKSLFAGSRGKKIAYRCAKLRELLDIKDTDLPVIRDLAVRNGFEHVDERLDEILPGFKQGSFASVSVSESPNATRILKHFNPRHLTISFADTRLSLKDCSPEISRIQSQINPALKKLAGPEFKIWP
jgi:hypothetical protein